MTTWTEHHMEFFYEVLLSAMTANEKKKPSLWDIYTLHPRDIRMIIETYTFTSSIDVMIVIDGVSLWRTLLGRDNISHLFPVAGVSTDISLDEIITETDFHDLVAMSRL